jgi:hypothetical protein
MTKSDLRTGMVVESRDGFIGVVLKNTVAEDGIRWIVTNSGNLLNCWEELDEGFNDNLTAVDDDVDSDIIKIYLPQDCSDYTTICAYQEHNLVWERDEVKEVTIKDIEDKFGCKVKIVG